jgi:hypothetical protein
VCFGPVSSRFGSFLDKFGLSTAVLDCFGPFQTSSEQCMLFRGRLNWAFRAISGIIALFQDRFGPFWIVSDCFRLV